MVEGRSRSSGVTAAAALQAVLFGLWPVLLIYTVTLGDYAPEQLTEPLIFVGSLNLAGWAILRLLKIDAARAAFIVSIFSLANLFYLPFSEFLTFPAKVFPVPVPDMAVLMGYFIILLSILLVVAQSELRIAGKAYSLNFEPAVFPAVLIAVVLCGFNLFTIVDSESRSNAIAGDFSHRYFQSANQLIVNKDAEKPDVYYVIIDGFANPATLKDLLGYDNRDFIDFLKQNDFYVAHKSSSNHDRTVLSVTSSLNMGLMNPLASRAKEVNAGTNVPLKLLRENRVMQIFKSAGYRIVNVCSGFCPTDHIPQADLNLRSGWGTGFNMSLLHVSMIGALEPYLHTVENEYASVRTAPIRRASEIANLPGPKFVLIHCLLTHPPFIFQDNGDVRPLTKQLLSAPYVKEPYVSQLKYTEKNLKELLGRLCRAGNGKSIVILQSDHGPACTDWQDGGNYILERMRILNAYRVPERMRGALYQSITPVNTFRVVLNDLFSADLPLQNDDSFIAIPPADWYKFENVTKLLKQSWK